MSTAPPSDAPLSTSQDHNPNTPPISILFVCLGNICRSPLAHAVFLSLLPSHLLHTTHVDSAGIGAYHALSPPDPRTMDILRLNNINDFDHAARKVTAEDFKNFDWILGMDAENVDDLRRARRRAVGKGGGEDGKGRVVLFGDFGGRVGEEVVDPYYGADRGFEVAYEQMVRFSKGFIEELEGR